MSTQNAVFYTCASYLRSAQQHCRAESLLLPLVGVGAECCQLSGRWDHTPRNWTCGSRSAKKPVLAGSCTMHITPANIFAKFGSFASTWQEGAHTWIAGKSTHLDRREATKTYLCKQVLNVLTLIPISMLIDQLQQRDRPP